MYKILDKEELNLFINKYFKEWGTDIRKVSVISYKGINEYLVNDHYIFVKNDIYSTSKSIKKW